MSSVMSLDAADYNAATDRVNSALELLRDEMKSLRHQDVTLMRQLVGINEKIRDIGREQRSAKCRAKRHRNRSITTTPSLNRQTTKGGRLSSLSAGYFDVIPEVRERSNSTCSSDSYSSSGSLTSLNEDTSGDEI